jgi:hypothetical protein
VIEKEVLPPIPPALTAECPEFELAGSGELTELLQVHAANMGRAQQCRSRHSALIQLLKELRENEEP